MNILKLLTETLFMSEVEMLAFLKQAPHRYKVYDIPKRSGKGYRTIAHPAKELKFIQRLVAEKCFMELPVHPCAQAYVKGLSIKTNIQQHLNSKYLLKMDFKDFFPSIVPTDWISYLKENGHDLNENDSTLISDIFFWHSKKSDHQALSIGAPTSPLISNLVMRPFDELLSKICEERDITYTRYADDLTLTTNVKDALFEIPEKVEEIIKGLNYPTLTINREKTVFSSKKHNRHVTGLVITNDNSISIGRDKKRVIKSRVFDFINNRLDHEGINKLKGHLSYIADVEPRFLLSLEKKYSKAVIQQIKES